MTTAVSAGEIDEGDSLCRFKYGNELASIGPMPPIQPAGGTACRIVHNPILAKDFLPQAKLRELDTVTCSSWALSMFKNHNAAKKKLDSMVSRHPKLRESLGDHFAHAILHAALGEMTQTNKNRHFELFEYVDVDVQAAFKLV